MTTSYQLVGDTHIVSLQGQLNSTNSVAVETEILALVAQGAKKLVIDLAGLDYISSAGLRVVLVAAKRLKQSAGKLVLAGMQPQVREVFDVSGFLAILTVAADRDAAIAQLAPAA